MVWSCSICGYSLEIIDSQRIDYCPNCGAHSHPNAVKNSGSSIEPCDYNMVTHDTPTSRFSATQLAEISHHEGEVVCPICCTPIEDGDIQITCPDCEVAYHKECWEDNKGCATYGCKSAQCLDVHASLDTAESLTPCPWCQTLLPPKTIICSNCGKRTDLYSSESSLGRNVSEFFHTIKDKLSLLWGDITRLCVFLRPYFLFVLLSYKKSLMLYAKFDGKTDRRDFACYAVIASLLSIILITVPGNLYLAYIFWATTTFPSISVMIRRLHDTGLSSWYICAFPVLPLLLFVPTDKSTKIENDSHNIKIEQG